MKIRLAYVLMILGFFTTSANVWSQQAESRDSLSEWMNVAATFEGKSTMLMRFRDHLSRSERNSLKAQGIDLQEFMKNDTAYLAVISKNILPQALNEFNFLYFKAYTINQKISESLAKALSLHSFPDFALRSDGAVKITLRCLRGFSLSAIKDDLLRLGAEIEYVGEQSRRITIWLEQDRLQELLGAAYILSSEIASAAPVAEYNRDRSNHRANFLSQDFAGGNTYNGEGIKVMLQDDGIIGPHIDYTGRLPQQYITFDNGDHGDHCSGILMGSGNRDPLSRGMAWGADLYVYGAGGYQGFDSIYNHYYSKNITISSTSYSDGCNAGYTSLAATLDEQIYNMPLLMHVFSAGNSGTQDCNYGAGAGWGNITGGHKNSKNSIAVGNLDNLDQLASSSSRGPVADGRLKPEVCAGGTSVYSTLDGHNYGSKTGTSMSCPGIAGALAMLSEAYLDFHGSLPHSSLLKAMLMNTSDDLGNPGPDFKFGYGRINGRKMLQPVSQHQFLIDSITNGQSNMHQIFIPGGLQKVKLMICWNDYPAAGAGNPALINDLDISVQSPTGTTYLPLVLNSSPDPAILDQPASNGTDRLNNHEQVVIDFPQAGNYQILISGFDVPIGPQTYSLTWYLEEFKELVLTYPNGGETHAPGENITLRWDAAADTQSFALSFTTDSGQTWTSINPAVSPAQRSLAFQIPVGSNDTKMKIKIARGFSVDESDMSFDVMGIPLNMQIIWTCPDSLMLRWDSVPEASAYDIFVLGNKYMDSIATTVADSFVFRNINAGNERYWLSVRARSSNGTLSRRAIAMQSELSVFCPNNIDVALTEIESPTGPFYTCMNIAHAPVSVKVKNAGLRNITQVPLYYSVNSGPVQTATLTDTLSYLQSVTLSFDSLLNLNTAGNYLLKVWCAFSGDGNQDNDTLMKEIRQIQQLTITPPWTESMETFLPCATDPNCGQTNCILTNGMMNAINGMEDDIDWRVNSGVTPTSGTGPSQDFLPGNAIGKYLYIEASGACNQQEAVLLSPCIDLSGFVNPRLTFAYHMSGSETGTLSMDIFSNGNWINSVFYRTGDQGPDWELMNISLNNYVGQTILVRFRGRTTNGELGDIGLDGIMIGNVSALEEGTERSFKIIPNPNKGDFILMPPEDMNDALNIQIFAADGKCVHNQRGLLQQGRQGVVVPANELSPGIYIISMSDGKKMLRGKMIIQP